MPSEFHLRLQVVRVDENVNDVFGEFVLAYAEHQMHQMERRLPFRTGARAFHFSIVQKIDED